MSRLIENCSKFSILTLRTLRIHPSTQGGYLCGIRDKSISIHGTSCISDFPCCVSRIKRRIAQIGEACGGPNQEKTLVIGKTATVQIEQIESLSIESSIVREWLLHPKCPS